MSIGLINFTMNAYKEGEKPKKPEQIIDLKDCFMTFKKNLPKTGPFKVISMEACGSSRGCAPSTNKARQNYMLGYYNEKDNIKTSKFNQKEAVMLNIRGKYTLPDKSEYNVYIRIPRSAVVGVRLGVSQSSYIKTNKSADSKIKEMMKKVTDDLFKFFKSKIPKMRESKIANINLHNLNLSNPNTREYPIEGPIKNFVFILREMDKLINTHDLDYDKKNGRQISKGTFKPVNFGEFASVGVTTWGMVDMLGCKKVSTALDIFDDFLKAFKKVKSKIEYNSYKSFPVTHSQKNIKSKGCPKGNPEFKDGKCPDDSYVPIPNKHGAICCYKKKLTSKLKEDIMKKYQNMKIPIPNCLLNDLSSYSASMKIPNKKNEVIYNKKGKYMYKEKSFKCMTMSKPDIISLAKLMKANPVGKKPEICNSIQKKAYEIANERYKRARKRLRIMAARYGNRS